MREQGRRGDLSHVATGQAMLAGDLLLNWTYETFASGTDLCPAGFAEAYRLLVQTVNEVLIGEMLDVELMTVALPSLEQIKRKTLLKTARYTFIGPLRIGHRLSPERQRADLDDFYERFGIEVGMAYQLQDDLLDVVGSADELQKPVGQDWQQHTLLGVRDEGPGYGSELISTHLSMARRAVTDVLLPEEGRTAFLDLLTLLTDRRR